MRLRSTESCLPCGARSELIKMRKIAQCLKAQEKEKEFPSKVRKSSIFSRKTEPREEKEKRKRREEKRKKRERKKEALKKIQKSTKRKACGVKFVLFFFLYKDGKNPSLPLGSKSMSANPAFILSPPLPVSLKV